jgi:hypothetical protein
MVMKMRGLAREAEGWGKESDFCGSMGGLKHFVQLFTAKQV